MLGLAAIRIAELEAAAGAREIGGNNAGPWVEKYLNAGHPQRVTERGEPWCVAFFLWCWLQVRQLPFAFTLSSHRLFERVPSIRCKGEPPPGLQPGDALFWNYHKDGTDAPTHTNMYHHTDEHGVLWTIGGNEGDEESHAPVKIKRRTDLTKLWGAGFMSALP